MAQESNSTPNGESNSATNDTDSNAQRLPSDLSRLSTVDPEKENADDGQRAPSTADSVDSIDMVNLPYRTLTSNAVMRAYTHETETGLHSIQSHRSGKMEQYELVMFKDNDPANPKNWSKAYKWYCTMTVAFTCFCVAFNSAVITSDTIGVSETFHVSTEVSLLPITLFVIGFGVGPMVFAPLSEIFGRRIVYATTLLVAVVFIIPCAVAQNIGMLLVCRLIDGIAFSAPMTLVGGSLADLWRSEERGVPMAAFSAAPFVGPVSGDLLDY